MPASFRERGRIAALHREILCASRSLKCRRSIRGDLLKKRPDIVIYPIRGRLAWQGEQRRVPELPEYNDLFDELDLQPASEAGRHDPIFGLQRSVRIAVHAGRMLRLLAA